MRSFRLLKSAALLGIGVLAACTGGSKFGSTQPPQAGTAPVSLTLTDVPPAGVSEISFLLPLNGATANPGNVSLLNTPITLDLKRLETDSTLLSVTNVPAGTYTSLTLNLGNPVMTFKNDTGATLASCAPGQVCQVTPSPPVLTNLTIMSAPFPVTISGNTPAGFQVDINVNNVLTPTLNLDFTAAGAVTLTSLPAVAATGVAGTVEDLLGQVMAKDAVNNQLTVQTALGTFTVAVDNNTLFQDFLSGGCSSANFGCVLVNQIVGVDANLLGSGGLLATRVELKDVDATESEVRGMIFAVDSGAQFRMVDGDIVPGATGLGTGNVSAVAVSGATTFSIDNEGQSNSTFTFNSSNDLVVGQEVQVKRLSSSSGTAINADRVTLGPSRFTATVASINTPALSFTVNGLPAMFNTAGIASITVQTSKTTEFAGKAATFSQLLVGDSVSLRGQLFKNGPNPPVLIVSKVLKR